MNFLFDTTVDMFAHNKIYFQNQLSEYVYYSKYAKWRDDLGRREVWEETVERTTEFLRELSGDKLSNANYKEMHDAILSMDVMPSMRLIAMAGAAARRENVSTYNCAAIPIDSIDSIVEVMYLSMNGVGIGFSVEKQFVEMLKPVAHHLVWPSTTVLAVKDSTEGWCNAFKLGLQAWFEGRDLLFDYSRIRPAGAPMRTKGGTASGFEPLKALLDFSRDLILRNQEKRLRPIDVYDIVTKIGDCVVLGGSRRTASLALFDFDDEEMLNAKNGEWWTVAPWRANANNSAVWPQDRPLSKNEVDAFFEVMDLGSNGEPGIFSRRAVMMALPERRSKEFVYGTNACGESILPLVPGENGGGGLCNLSSIVARNTDSFVDLMRKARVAAMIGTVQSMATDFYYLRKGWKENAERERLLGVDLTGQFDCAIARSDSVQFMLRRHVVDVNREFARKLGIGESMATTVVKPSGNSGALLNVSSGVHPRWSQFYVRNVRVNVDSPFYRVLVDSGMRMVKENEKTFVVGFPTAAPVGSITRHQINALQHLEYWKQTKLNYAEHSVSCTVYYAHDEKNAVKQWIFKNQDFLTGLSFLPKFDANYENAPFVEIDQQQFGVLSSEFPAVDYSLLQVYDAPLYAAAQQEIACSANKCDVIA